jgi:hypothetical protein
LPSIRARINCLLNLSLFAAVTAVIFSGILISQKAVPALTGSKPAPDMDWRWDTLHNQFSAIVVMLVGFHLAINWQWALAARTEDLPALPAKRTMKFVRVLSRLPLLSVVAGLCRRDGNLRRFSAASFARSAVARRARASSVGTRSRSFPRTHW